MTEQEAELKLNIRKRGICKSKLTSFSKYLSTLTSFPDSINDVKLIELESRLHKFPDIFSEFDTYQSFIEVNSENMDEQFLEREQFENSYYSLLAC